jgi:hypothetical protein
MVRGWLLSKGISPTESSRVTLQEYHEARKAEQQHQLEEWRRARWLATIICNANGATINDKPVQPTDLLRLADEPETAAGIPITLLKQLADHE